MKEETYGSGSGAFGIWGGIVTDPMVERYVGMLEDAEVGATLITYVDFYRKKSDGFWWNAKGGSVYGLGNKQVAEAMVRIDLEHDEHKTWHLA